jgi:DNA helicase-2/ATP-dependent DNA helicase PcrA
MPIDLANLATTSKTVKKWSPKFFDKTLTGVGKKSGLLNEDTNPIHIAKDTAIAVISTNLQKRSSKSGPVKTNYIPVSILSEDVLAFCDTLRYPDVKNMLKITKSGKDVYLTMDPYNMELQCETQPAGPDKKTLTVCYKIGIYAIVQSNAQTAKNKMIHQNIPDATSIRENSFAFLLSCNPALSLKDICDTLTRHGYDVDYTVVDDWFANYSLYDHMCQMTQTWHDNIDVIIKEAIENAIAYNNANNTERAYNTIIQTFKYLESFEIPLDKYRDIYAICQQLLKPDIIRKLCKYNLNLLLSDTLNSLESNKGQLNTLPSPTKPYMGLASKEQKAAIESTEPLILVQAGAGTGKSTVILSRIKYMVDNGVNPNDITVLSFTNAAADNITAKNPNVNSMTIARMIHTIYSENFSHELAPLETIVNSIEIQYGGPNGMISDPVAHDFRKRLIDITKNNPNGYTNLNNFIEMHFDDVINILNTINMTSLELEIIICYQQIDTLKEPNTITSKYLIIDEVQDNAIFEFIYTLKYVNKHKESLFIVGDCSQTLYEFRGSNPKALNILEGSGVFAAYSLQINYRSNQEILDFANIALQNIEANQYAHIQLQANSLATVTEQSFTEKVRFKYLQLHKQADFKDELPHVLTNDIKPYLDEKLAAGEQIAFLSFTRNHANEVKKHLEIMYPGAKMATLIPEKIRSSTIFSDFIRKYWKDLKFMPINNTMSIIKTAMDDKLKYLVFNEDKVRPALTAMWAEFYTQSNPTIIAWQAQVQSGHMKPDEFLENVKDLMLKYEIRNNGIKQALISARNEQTKKSQSLSDANFLFSTIHSAKGLEFQNVVVLYRNENIMDEDKKRMYYVALTRATNSEFILAYDTTPSPRIEDDYRTIVEQLHKTHPIPQNGPVQTVTQPAANTPLMPAKVKVQITPDPIPDEDGSEETTA